MICNKSVTKHYAIKQQIFSTISSTHVLIFGLRASGRQTQNYHINSTISTGFISQLHPLKVVFKVFIDTILQGSFKGITETIKIVLKELWKPSVKVQILKLITPSRKFQTNYYSEDFSSSF
jgi:hypothetical protein